MARRALRRRRAGRLRGADPADREAPGIGGDIALGDAKLDIALGAGKVDVKEISGSGLGGRCSGQIQIDKAPAGAALSGVLRLADGKLEALGGDAARPRVAGAMRAALKFSGRAASPRAMLSALQGKGTLELGEAKLATLWPGAVAMAVEAALKADGDKLTNTLQQSLLAALPAGVLPLGPGTFALEIAEGQLRIKPFAIDTADGRASGTASLDLRTFNVESDWRLDQKPPAQGSAEKPLPGVTVAYRGPVAALSALEPRIATDALEKELGVRRWSARWRSWSACAGSTSSAAARRPNACASSSSRRRPWPRARSRRRRNRRPASRSTLPASLGPRPAS